MSERRLMALGASSGIGRTAYAHLMRTGVFTIGNAWGEADFGVGDTEKLREVVATSQPTDVLYSVGVNILDWIKDVEYIDFAHVMQANVWGFLNLMRTLHVYGAGPANVVVVTSDAAWRPMRTSAIYCASKAALEMAVRVASREYAPAGWRVNAVAPGKVEDTPMTRYVDQKVLRLRGWSVEAAESYEVASTPLGRKVTKEEVAEVIAQVLFGPKAQTGEIIAVNGGR